MKMDIVESDLKQLFMWIKNLEELCKSQQAVIDELGVYDSVQDEQIRDIEHDLALVLSVIKDRKDST